MSTAPRHVMAGPWRGWRGVALFMATVVVTVYVLLLVAFAGAGGPPTFDDPAGSTVDGEVD